MYVCACVRVCIRLTIIIKEEEARNLIGGSWKQLEERERRKNVF